MNNNKWLNGSSDAEAVPIVPVVSAGNPVPTLLLHGTAETAAFINEPPAILYGAIPTVVVENVCIDAPLDEKDGISTPICRDSLFAIIFVLHLAVVVCLGTTYAPHGLDDIPMNITSLAKEIQESDDVSFEDFETFQRLWEETQAYVAVYPKRILALSVLPACIMAFIISLFTTNVFIRACPQLIVTSSLFGPLTVVMVLLLIAITSNDAGWFSVALVLCMLVMVIYFIVAAWRMIPYAAVNLAVALEGISSNSGTYLLAFLLAELNCAWSFAWLYVLVGVLSWEEQHCHSTYTTLQATNATHLENGNELDSCGQLQGWTFLLLFISLYWTSTVIANVLQVTVAGVMATWCFDKREATGCCSPAVYSSLFRSLSYSFGSICFGSLVQALVGVIRCLLNFAKSQQEDLGRNVSSDGGGVFLCIMECLVMLLDDIVQYINQWAFVFVGIYGYSYWESGKRVMELFRSRGWTSLITNSLVNYVLGFTTLTVGILNGAVALVTEAIVTEYYRHLDSELGITPPLPSSDSYIFGPLPGWRYWAFGIGFVMGVSVCSVVMNVIQGAVNTLIVCWADAPAKLEENHPAATQAMAAAWGKVFPESTMYFSPYGMTMTV